ncbi:hypothetical protein LKO27_13430 [Tessaracoccus sp. OS52]|uniref:hypothetical protein n=1 Tax=Tessaracoccus sp. OS52 TaxID=2886691 RepID=UPI001D108BD8|nr:hypothetical protein [Tessaracoccus sp. OS52]MCC2594405.1 hypothetical protein [Tessaracoccus sp. OS52]
MNITTKTLTRGAGVAAAAAGLIFLGVQVNHPPLDANTITTLELAVRNTLKLLMAVFALIGITGMYLSQVRRNGIVGLVGFLGLAAGYLLILCSSFLAAFVLPAIAPELPGFVNAVLITADGGQPASDIGILQTMIQIQGLAYLVGGTVFGIALFRAGVLWRWASALLAIGGLVSFGLSLLPDAFHRLLAVPNGVALVALGFSLWRSTRAIASSTPIPADEHPSTAGAR